MWKRELAVKLQDLQIIRNYLWKSVFKKTWRNLRFLIKKLVLAVEYHMQSCVDNYKVMPIARNNLNCSYTLLGSKLTVTIQGEKTKT